MNYTRKRALLACDFCRHRKRRCDGERPCSTCRESGADCRYKDLPVERVDFPTPSTGGSDILGERLGRIEVLLEEQNQRLNELAQGRGSSGASTGGPFQSSLSPLPPSYSSYLQQQQHHQHHHDLVPVVLDPHLDHSQFLIPADHFTSASSLFALPRVKRIVGEYPKNYFHDIEDNLPLPPQLDPLHSRDFSWPSLDVETLDILTRNYFKAVHPNYPIFTPQDFHRWRSVVLEQGPTDTPETAICLCVWALGAVVPGEGQPTPMPPHIQEEKDRLGHSFFQPALRLVLGWSIWGFNSTMTICQALLLAASYFAHMGRPLHSWKMVYFASLKFMFLHDKQKRSGGYVGGQDNTYLRVFWACLMVECDRAAELDVPRSGIEPMADRMPLAKSQTPDEHEEMMFFVAETAVRRLLNRVHSSLYSSENWDLIAFAEPGPGAGNLSLTKLVNVSSELNRQLEEWYMSIPDELRPPIGTEPIEKDRGKVLRIRFYAARHVIHRPFVLYAALQQQQAASRATSVGSSPVSPHLSGIAAGSSSAAAGPAGPSSSSSSSAAAAASQQQLPLQIPQIVLDKCETCIVTCKSYLRNVVGMLDKRSPYLWSFSQSCMACFFVLLACDSIPQLQQFTTEIGELQDLVLPYLKRWATPGSSFEAEVRILERITPRDRMDRTDRMVFS